MTQCAQLARFLPNLKPTGPFLRPHNENVQLCSRKNRKPHPRPLKFFFVKMGYIQELVTAEYNFRTRLRMALQIIEIIACDQTLVPIAFITIHFFMSVYICNCIKGFFLMFPFESSIFCLNCETWMPGTCDATKSRNKAEENASTVMVQNVCRFTLRELHVQTNKRISRLTPLANV